MSIRESARRIRELSFEMGPIRPPSEGGSFSLLIRATRNCPWNRCRFCSTYKGAKFELRPVEEVKQDIDAAACIASEIRACSWKLGFGGALNTLVIQALIREAPDLAFHHPFVNVANWLLSGAKTAFLQDANSLILPAPKLIEILTHLKSTFPTLERITSYARSHTLYRKSFEDLKEIREAGLVRLHVGLESGDDEILRRMEKGATASQHIEGGRKAVEAGFELSEYVMPGLGGRELSERHARKTAEVLNEINPHFIRLRPLAPRRGSPLWEEWERGEFELLSPHEILRELRIFVEELKVESRLCFDHFLNPTFRSPSGGEIFSGERVRPLFSRSYDGYKLPEQKEEVLKLIEEGLSIPEELYISPAEYALLPSL